MSKKYAANKEKFMSYSNIAKIMTDQGDKMNHSTARKYTFMAIEKLTLSLLIHKGMPQELAEERAAELSRDPEWHETLKDLVDEAMHATSV